MSYLDIQLFTFFYFNYTPLKSSQEVTDKIKNNTGVQIRCSQKRKRKRIYKTYEKMKIELYNWSEMKVRNTIKLPHHQGSLDILSEFLFDAGQGLHPLLALISRGPRSYTTQCSYFPPSCPTWFVFWLCSNYTINWLSGCAETVILNTARLHEVRKRAQSTAR